MNKILSFDITTVLDFIYLDTWPSNELSDGHTCDHFEPIARLKQAPKTQFLGEAGDTLVIFQLFFPDEKLQSFADNTNKSMHIPNPIQAKKNGGTDANKTFACK